MARVTVEDCVDKVPNRFDLVLLSAQRARQISGGAELTIDRDRDKNPVVALREVAEETVKPQASSRRRWSAACSASRSTRTTSPTRSARSASRPRRCASPPRRRSATTMRAPTTTAEPSATVDTCIGRRRNSGPAFRRCLFVGRLDESTGRCASAGRQMVKQEDTSMITGRGRHGACPVGRKRGAPIACSAPRGASASLLQRRDDE